MTGRAAIFKESEIIKSLLINDGIKKDIIIMKEDPYNTYENIIVVNEYLMKKNVNSVIFLTSPYHTLRQINLEKNFPNIDIIIPRMIDTPIKDIKWD